MASLNSSQLEKWLKIILLIKCVAECKQLSAKRRGQSIIVEICLLI